MTNEFDWAAFLRRWNDALLASPLADELPPDVRASGWLGFLQATDAQVAAAEDRLKITLPPSYKAFLRISNGWHKTTHAINRIWGTDEIDWFRKRNRDWIAAYTFGATADGPLGPTRDEDYFAYGPLAADFREDHLKQTLQISAEGDAAVYLLNPQVITKDGEWEAWFFANWLPGAHRYRSFYEMMQADYASFAGLDWKQPIGVLSDLPDVYVGAPGSRTRRIKARRPKKPGPSTEMLRAALHDSALARKLFPRAGKLLPIELASGLTPEGQTRRQVVMTLARRHDPAAAGPLIDMLTREREPIIRQELVETLGAVITPQVIEVLFSLVTEESDEAAAAIRILSKHAPDRLVPQLLRLIALPDSYLFYAAISTLTDLAPDRAAEALARLIEIHYADNQILMRLQSSLAGCGKHGLAALVQLLDHPERSVRRAAASGIAQTGISGAADFLQPLLNDPDTEIRQIAELGMKVLPCLRPS